MLNTRIASTQKEYHRQVSVPERHRTLPLGYAPFATTPLATTPPFMMNYLVYEFNQCCIRIYYETCAPTYVAVGDGDGAHCWECMSRESHTDSNFPSDSPQCPAAAHTPWKSLPSCSWCTLFSPRFPARAKRVHVPAVQVCKCAETINSTDAGMNTGMVFARLKSGATNYPIHWKQSMIWVRWTF